MVDNYAVVILYYRHGVGIAQTVKGFLSQEPPPEVVIVVDNGSADGVCAAALDMTDSRVRLITSPTNRGYAGGMRLGMSAVPQSTPLIVFATHEVQIAAGAVRRMIDVREEFDAAQVGPALYNAETRKVWSYGGVLTRFGAPRHRVHQPAHPVVAATWLDGCCYLARNEEATYRALDERYFLYWEDIHFSNAISEGGPVLVAVDARASQTTGSTPPYFAARNRVLFWRTQGRADLAVIASIATFARLIVRAAKRDTRRRLSGLLRGAIDGWTSQLRPSGWSDVRTRRRVAEIRLVNPLGASLKHYTRELVDVLESIGVSVSVVHIPEPSQGRSRVGWVISYAFELFKARFSPSTAISTWPVLGLFDIPLLHIAAGRHARLVLHDPTPLVRAIGYGRFAKALASRPYGAQLICHSDSAESEIRGWYPANRLFRLPHPILSNQSRKASEEGGRMPHTIVRVLGQWKSSRDIEAMKSVAAAAYDGNPRFEVVGRGWPEVDGWSVDNRFVPEAELDNLIHSSQVVLIPYSRFYQSGIAIRALENNRVTVGPADSSLADILGADSRCLVHDADWVGAVRQALLRSNKDVSEDRNRYEVLTRNEYERFVEEFFL